MKYGVMYKGRYMIPDRIILFGFGEYKPHKMRNSSFNKIEYSKNIFGNCYSDFSKYIDYIETFHKKTGIFYDDIFFILDLLNSCEAGQDYLTCYKKLVDRLNALVQVKKGIIIVNKDNIELYEKYKYLFDRMEFCKVLFLSKKGLNNYLKEYSKSQK